MCMLVWARDWSSRFKFFNVNTIGGKRWTVMTFPKLGMATPQPLLPVSAGDSIRLSELAVEWKLPEPML